MPGGDICVQKWCVQHACSCQQADCNSNVSGQCTLFVKLLLALWEGTTTCSFPKCFEMGTLGRICWHTGDNSLLLQLLVILHRIWAMLSLLSASFSGLYTEIKGKNSLYENYKDIYISRNWTKPLSQYFVSLFCSNLLEFSLNPFTNLAPPTELSSFQQTYSTLGERIDE